MSGTNDFKFADWPSPRTFMRAGKAAIFDLCRQILVPATPEEDVRQRFIAYLISGIGIPKASVYSEEPLCHYEGGGRGRIDIVVWDERSGDTLLIVECKAAGMPP